MKMAKKTKTIDEKIDDLSAMTQRGFADLKKEMTDGFALTATKAELKEVKETVDRIEYTVNTHERRIENLEDKVRVI